MAAVHEHRFQHEHFALFVLSNSIREAIERAQVDIQCASPRLHLLNEPAKVEQFHQVYCLAAMPDLVHDDVVIDTLRQLRADLKRFLIFAAEETGPESSSEVIVRLNIHSPERIHTPRFHSDNLDSFCRRFVGSLCASDSHRAILDAWWAKDLLVVKSASFESIKVPLSSLPRKLREASESIRRGFGIDEDGDMVHWENLDIDMGWEQFQQAVDPAALLRARQASEQFNQRYGRAIKRLREERGLSQDDIEDIDARTIRRVEHGERATLRTLERLAEAHGLNINDYMNELARILPTVED